MDMRCASLTVALAAAVAFTKSAEAGPPLKSKTKGESLSTRNGEGTRPIDVKQFADKIRSMDENQLVALAKSLAEESRSSARMAARIFGAPDEDAADSAQILLVHMDEAAILALVESTAHPKVADRVWVLRAAVQAETALRRKLMKRLERSLDDRTEVPTSLHGPVERMPPKQRVCDQAYLLLRKMILVGEDLNEVLANEDAFLNMPDEVKDAKIREARRSGQWTRAITGKDVEE
jgi:hypothetical protein